METLQDKIDNHIQDIPDAWGTTAKCISLVSINKAIQELREEVAKFGQHCRKSDCSRCRDILQILALIGESKK